MRSRAPAPPRAGARDGWSPCAARVRRAGRLDLLQHQRAQPLRARRPRPSSEQADTRKPTASTRTCRSRRSPTSAPTSTSIPHERRVDVRGHYRAAQHDRQPITELHVRHRSGRREVRRARLPRRTSVVSDDSVHGYTIYRLEAPLAPGATMDFDYTCNTRRTASRITADDTQVVDNGTFFNNSPRCRSSATTRAASSHDRNERRKYGLPRTAAHEPKIDDIAARADQPTRPRRRLGRLRDHGLDRRRTRSRWRRATCNANGPRTAGRYFHYKIGRS